MLNLAYFCLLLVLEIGLSTSVPQANQECLACHLATAMLSRGNINHKAKEICKKIPNCEGAPKISLCEILSLEPMLDHSNNTMSTLFKRIHEACSNQQSKKF